MAACSGIEIKDEIKTKDLKGIENLFKKIANSAVSVKSQQRGDPDLSTDEKIKTIRELFVKSPGSFLCRFKKYLDAEDISCLVNLESDYEAKFYMNEIRRFNTVKGHHTQVRNRRYKYMKELESTSDYFEFENMRQRSPLLFEQFVGKYMNEKEITALKGPGLRSDSLSGFLLDCVENTHRNVKYCIEQAKEDCVVEEDDDSDEEEMLVEQEANKRLTTTDKELLQEDFLALMQERFLNGDEDIDYSVIDNNEEYDSLDIREHDEEEKYFDED